MCNPTPQNIGTLLRRTEGSESRLRLVSGTPILHVRDDGLRDTPRPCQRVEIGAAQNAIAFTEKNAIPDLVSGAMFRLGVLRSVEFDDKPRRVLDEVKYVPRNGTWRLK